MELVDRSNDQRELIKLTQQSINNEMIKTVNARELHRELGVGRDFSTWIKSRLETLGSIENEDYITSEVLLPKSGEQRGGHNRLEYHITLDLAKHLAMMEKSEIGKKVRDYFIQCEKELREISSKARYQLEIINASSEVDRMVALNEYEVGYVRPLEMKVEEQAKTIEQSKPKLKYHDIVLSCSDLMTITQISQDYPISNQKLNKILADKGIQYKDKSGMWCLYVQYGAQGYAQTHTHTYQDKDGNYHSKLYLKWTQKGRLFIYDLLKEEGILPTCEAS